MDLDSLSRRSRRRTSLGSRRTSSASPTSKTASGAVNWKILVEGGIEAYHFKVAHAKTIGPHFMDNLSSYRSFGPNLRSVLPRSTLTHLVEQPRQTWNLREHANLIYYFFPTSQLLVQQDHLVWIDLLSRSNH